MGAAYREPLNTSAHMATHFPRNFFVIMLFSKFYCQLGGFRCSVSTLPDVAQVLWFMLSIKCAIFIISFNYNELVNAWGVG